MPACGEAWGSWQWRQARAQLRALPAITRAGIIRLWEAAWYPADPAYLLDVIRRTKRGKSAWTVLREWRQFSHRTNRRNT